MSPADREEFRRMLANALQPMQEEIDAIRRADYEAVVDPLKQEIAKLKAKDEKHSGQHKLALGGLQTFKVENEETRAADLGAIAKAMNNLIEISKETVERQARTEQNVAEIKKQSTAAQFHETDAAKGTSVRPASVVAAENAIANTTATKVMAVDVKSAGESTAAMQKWQKRVTTPLLVVVPILVEVYRQLFPHH